MMKMLGEYGGEVQPEILLRNSPRASSGASPDILDLQGKRFVVASETNQGEVFNTGVVKRLTGGDTLIGRAVYGKDMIRFSPSHTICLQTNYAPNATAEDSAFWTRVMMLNFKRVFVDNPDPKNPLQLPKNPNIEEDFSKKESLYKMDCRWCAIV
jgi:putative DNA primase/helicase